MRNLLIVILLILYGCAIDQPISSNFQSNIPIQVTSFGSQSTLDIITWNIENFPKNGNITVDAITDIIRDLNVDIIALQEIEGSSSFNDLIESLECLIVQSNIFGDCDQSLGWASTENGCEEIIGCDNYDSSIKFYSDFSECNNTCTAVWEGFRSNSASYSINLAYLYNSSKISINSIYEIFNDDDDWWPFPRPPLVLEFKYENQDIIIINNHFKCCNGSEDRRESATNLLQQYILDEFNDKRVIIVGDLNDSITDSESSNVFTNLLNDTLFYFADMNIALGSSSNWSYPTYPSHIDHIIISNELFDNFNNSIETIKIDNELNGGWNEYVLNISDHRPVGIRLDLNN